MTHNAHIYIRRDAGRAILVTVHTNQDGIGFEHDTPTTIESPIAPDRLGDVARSAASATDKRDKQLRNMKPTDWPAYRSSGAKSVRQFQEEFIALQMAAANDSNLVYVITGRPVQGYALEVSASIASSAPASEIGKLVMRVYEACRDKAL